MCRDPVNPMPSEARPYRLFSDAQLARAWRDQGCPVTLTPVVREFLHRYYTRQWESAEAGGPTELAPLPSDGGLRLLRAAAYLHAA